MKKLVIPLAILFVALLVVAAFFDLPIDIALYHPQSAFGHFFATAAALPFVFCAPLSVGLYAGAFFPRRKTLGRNRLVLFGLVWAAGTIALVYTYCSYIWGHYSLPVELAFLTGFVIIAIAGLWLAMRQDRLYPDEVLRTAFTGLVPMAAGMALLFVLKLVWGRQRFCTMDMDKLALQFSPWYKPRGPGSGDTFRSFPSGHTMRAMFAFWLAFFPAFIKGCRPHLKAWTYGITACAALFALLTMFSRLILGMHFLSDVVMSAALFLIVLGLVQAFINRIHP
jgi:membrane-associated phospholipid phosphatase